MRFSEYLFRKMEKQYPFLVSTDTETVVMMGRHANAILKNPAIDSAFKKIEQGYIEAWKMSAPKDQEAREKIYYMLQGLGSFKLKLQGMVQEMIYEENIEKQNDSRR